jgi:hypothetical protein
MRPAVLIVCVVSGCAKAPLPKPVEVVAPAPVDPKAGVRAVVQKAYGALERGEAEGLKGVLVTDAMAYGLSPSETFSDQAGVVAAARQALLPVGLGTATLEIKAGVIEVGLCEGGQSAWFWDLPRVEWKPGKGKPTSWLLRVTGHAVKIDEDWRLDAVHVSLGVPDERVFAVDAAKKYLPPADVLAERGPESDQIVGLSRRILDDVGVKFERTSERDEMIQIGTGPTELFEGGKSFKDLIRPRLAELKKAAFSYKVDGPIRSRLAPGRTSGWVAANVVLRLGVGKKQQTLPPFRVLWVFAQEQGVWNLVSEHQSLALKEELRSAATDEEIARHETLEKNRRVRLTPPEKRELRTPHDAGPLKSPDAGSSLPEKGRVTESTDGGMGTFD